MDGGTKGSPGRGVKRRVGRVLLASLGVLATGESGHGGRSAAARRDKGDSGEAEGEGQSEVEYADGRGAQMVCATVEHVGWSGEVAAGAASV